MSDTTHAPLVSIICLVYNHAPYLRECLEGFVMQQTNFPFEAIVHDDASPDGSAAIIREYAEKYPHIIKPVLQKENLYSRKDDSLGKAIGAALSPDSRYIAYCEGDDFWTDPRKLQKQVDLLESHPEYSMCCSGYVERIQETGAERSIYVLETTDLDLATQIDRNRVITNTTLLRRELWARYYREVAPTLPDWPMGDYPQSIWMAAQGPIYCAPELMTCYRVLKESASHSRDDFRVYRFNLSAIDISIFFSLEFGVPCRHLWKRRRKFVLEHCLKHGWWKAMLHDLFHPNIHKKKLVKG